MGSLCRSPSSAHALAGFEGDKTSTSCAIEESDLALSVCDTDARTSEQTALEQIQVAAPESRFSTGE